MFNLLRKSTIHYKKYILKQFSTKVATYKTYSYIINAKTKFSKIPGSKEFQDLTASTWINTTCRNIQTAIIKTFAYNNRSALKLAFREEYDKLYPGSIYSPPSYNENFSSAEG